MKNLNEMDLAALRENLNGLATARECPVVYADNVDGQIIPKACPDYKAIVNNKTGKVEAIPSKGYTIIQHKDAFSAVVDALAAATKGQKFKAEVMEQNGRAWMTVVFSDVKADDGCDGIELGIKATNSYDKTSALHYSGTSKQNKAGFFEFFGLRLVCKNGMTVKVPLGDISKLTFNDKANAQVGDIVDIVKQQAVETNQMRTSIRHFGNNTQMDITKVGEMIMALPIVARRLEEQIKAVKSISCTKEEAVKRLEELGFGDRASASIMARYMSDEQTVWGLYNSITAHATHEEKVSPLSTERILKKAEMLMTVRGASSSPSQ
ncbi:Uncharacterised protein [Candidatus Anstonella stagnisolia]|nr:Uncharacterised protein [Candidatus Anstonella stagnisolia]